MRLEEEEKQKHGNMRIATKLLYDNKKLAKNLNGCKVIATFNDYNSFVFSISLLFFFSDFLIFLTRSILIPLVYGSYYKFR